MMKTIRTLRQILTATYGYLFLAIAVYVLQAGFVYLHKNINQDVISYGVAFVKPFSREKGEDLAKLKEKPQYLDSFFQSLTGDYEAQEQMFRDENSITYFNGLALRLEKSMKKDFEALTTPEAKAAFKAKVDEAFKSQNIEAKFDNVMIDKADKKETITKKVEVFRRLLAL